MMMLPWIYGEINLRSGRCVARLSAARKREGGTVQGGSLGRKVETTGRVGIIVVMKNEFKCRYYHASCDRLLLLLLSISLIVGLVSAGQVWIVSMGVSFVLMIVFCVRLLVEKPRDSHRSSSECLRKQEAMNALVGLANRMHVRLHPTKSLEMVPGLRNAKARPCLFFSGRRVHCGGRVQICCTVLCGLEGLALEGVLAHELAHLKKRHLAKALLPVLALAPVLIHQLVSTAVACTPMLLSFTVFGLLISLVSWHNEYEADAVAADYVGKERMAYALERVEELLHRRRDTLSHPSFKRRISRLVSDED